MKSYRVVSVAPCYPAVRLTFDDGLAGDLDLSDYLAKGGHFEPLRNSDFFAQVRLGRGGRCFGWRLDEIGNELDFSADGARADIETAIVEELAERHRRKLQHAAE